MHEVNADYLKDQIYNKKFRGTKMTDTEYALNKDILSSIKS